MKQLTNNILVITKQFAFFRGYSAAQNSEHISSIGRQLQASVLGADT